MSGVVSHIELRDPIFLGRGGGTFVLVGLASTDGPVESLVPKLHQRADSLANQLRGRYPNVKLELTGEIPLNFDIRKASADDVHHGESLVIPGDPRTLAAGLRKSGRRPDPIGRTASLPSRSLWPITGFLGERWHLSILVQNLATMLGPGPGNRLRTPHGQPIPRSNLRRARWVRSLAHRGASGRPHTLLISASTVAIGFLALLTVPISEIRSIGIAGFLVAGLSVLLDQYPRPGGAAGVARSGASNAGRLPFTPKLDPANARRTYGKSLAAMGQGGDRRPSLARHPHRRRAYASARLAGHAARYQRS